MANIKTLVLTLPTHWASPLVNGDESGLDDAECAILEKFTRSMIRTYGSCHCADVSEDTHFARYHDATDYGVLACDVAEFTFLEG